MEKDTKDTVELRLRFYTDMAEEVFRMDLIRDVLKHPCDYADATLDYIRRIAGPIGGDDD